MLQPRLSARIRSAPLVEPAPLTVMSARIPPKCPHELRPGTVTCLYCSRDAREAARTRLLRFLGRAVAVGAAGLVIISGGSELIVSLHARAAAPSAEAAELTEVRGALPSPDSASTNTPPATEEPPAPVRTSHTPRIPEGRTELGDGMYAVRTGGHVVVHFDLLMRRTRRSEKFERLVRETLPRIHGPLADSLLAEVRRGELTGNADLLHDLPARGIHLPSIGAPALSLFPETRSGRDGPLVVAYRITPGR